MAERFENILKAICADPEHEDTWLEMLSQLEYAGCRKIVKAVPFARVTPNVLQHIMEESSHAFLLRSLLREERDWTHNPLMQTGWGYFQQLDHQVSALEEDSFSYPLVAWIIEQRVLEIYPAYLQATQRPGVRRIVTRILAQEKGHSEIHGLEKTASRAKAQAVEIEARLWDGFLAGLEEWLGIAAVPAANSRRVAAAEFAQHAVH